MTPVTTKGSDYVYNYVTQIQAAERCQKMYDNTKPFTSDLINSYAWDTATLFLQECGTNSKYSRQNSVNTSLATTGTNNESTKDVQCNVYDMASNVFEWTTETSSNAGNSCTCRGGIYNYSSDYMSIRNYSNTSVNDSDLAFRPILYL